MSGRADTQALVLRACSVLFEPGQVTELRAFVPGRRGYTDTLTGYFDDFDALAAKAAQIDAVGAEAVYVVLNPVRPDLLARANNRMRRAKRGEATANADVLNRRWLFLDFDPARPSGISSTEAEHTAALERATACREWLGSLGFPAPVLADSGNGAHLLYRVDLDADDGGLVQRSLIAVANRFGDDEVEVDTTVHNAARLCKLYGTTARKGDATDARPHRRSALLDVPETLEPVPTRLLEALAAKAPTNGKGQRGGGSSDPEAVRSALMAIPPRPAYPEWVKVIAAVLDGLGGDEVLAEAALKLWSPEERAGEYAEKLRHPLATVSVGTLYWLAQRHGWQPPWEAGRRDGGERRARGAVVLAAEAEPPVAVGTSHTEGGHPAPGWVPFPVATLPPACAEYARAKAAAVGCDVAFVAAPMLAVLAAAVGNSFAAAVKTSWRETSAVWLGIVASSGGGKSPAIEGAMLPVYRLERKAREHYDAEREAYDRALERYEALSKKERVGQERPEKPARPRFRIGDATVESTLMIHEENPRGLLNQRDELAGWLDLMNRYAKGEADVAVWIELWGGRPVVVDRKSGDKQVLYVERPNVSVLGGIQPGVLKDRAGRQLLDSGFMARLLLLMPPERPLRFTDADVPPDVREGYATTVEAVYALPASEEALPLSTEGRRLFASFVNENADLYDALTGPLRSALVKLPSYAARFALALHLADYAADTERPPGVSPGAITAGAVARAVTLIRWFRHEAARIYERFGLHGVDPSERDAGLAAAATSRHPNGSGSPAARPASRSLGSTPWSPNRSYIRAAS